MRRSLIPSALTVKRVNQDHGVDRTQLFELNKIYLARDGEKLPEEKSCLVIVEEDGFYALKGTVTQLLVELGLGDAYLIKPHELSCFDAARSVLLEIDGRTAGFLGQISGKVQNDVDLRSAVCMCELDFDLLAELAQLDRSFSALPRYPAIDRDLAVVVDEDVPWGEIERCVWDSGIELVEHVQFFDVYRGDQVGPGRKSLAFSIRFRSPERTLTNDEVSTSIETVVRLVKDRFSAALRA